MGLAEHWRSADRGTRAFIVIVSILGICIAIGLIDEAIKEHEFKKLPPEEQARRIAEDKRWAKEAAQRRRQDTRRLLAAQAEERAAKDALEREQEFHRDNVKACVEAAAKYLPGLWPSAEAKARIEADCAMREARAEGIQTAPAQ
jgi:hypothetical protein